MESKIIGADNFNPLEVFNEYAGWFAGPAPYLFFMFAKNLHQAVAAGKHPILLSGLGGDQGVSGHAPLNFYLPHLIKQGQYQQVWRDLTNNSSKFTLAQRIKYSLHFIKYMYPALYEMIAVLKKYQKILNKRLRPQSNSSPAVFSPYLDKCYKTLREAEWNLLQGRFSHEVRMRIEYSSIISKKMGFEYRYPLLYPKLIEFLLSVPLAHKRHNGQARYLLRRYLARFIPESVFNSYRKKGGLGIVPSTFDLYQQQYKLGSYQQEFRQLPFKRLIKNRDQSIELRNFIKGFMLQACMA